MPAAAPPPTRPSSSVNRSSRRSSELLDRQHPQPYGRELDRERDAVEAAADPLDRLLVAGGHREVGQRRRAPARLNSRTASYRANDSAGSGSAPEAGSDSAGTASVCSPAMPRTCRLVARIRSSGGARSSVVDQRRAGVQQVLAVVQDQQARLVPQLVDQGVQRRARGLVLRCPAPAGRCARAARGSPARPARPATRRPGNARRTSAATRVASRVLPTPPTPVSVTSRDPDSRRLTSATSRRRPTKLVTSAGSPVRPRPEVFVPIVITGILTWKNRTPHSKQTEASDTKWQPSAWNAWITRNAGENGETYSKHDAAGFHTAETLMPRR